MSKCQLCGYSNKKKNQFFRCWNKATKTGCKRYTCNNCIFVMQKTTSYENFICPNTFCNEEHEAEALLGLKEWFVPDKKVAYEKRVKLLENREKEVEKKLDTWENKISANTKRMLFTATRASESSALQQYFYEQLEFDFNSYQTTLQQSLWLTNKEYRNALLTKITINIDPDLMQYQPQLVLRHSEIDILQLQLTGENLSYNLNYHIKNYNPNDTNTMILATSINLQQTQEYTKDYNNRPLPSDGMSTSDRASDHHKIILTFEFIAMGGGKKE